MRFKAYRICFSCPAAAHPVKFAQPRRKHLHERSMNRVLREAHPLKHVSFASTGGADHKGEGLHWEFRLKMTAKVREPKEFDHTILRRSISALKKRVRL